VELRARRGPDAAWESVYVVRAGDTLSHIAERFYGSSQDWPRIATANALQPPYLLHEGDALELPGAAKQTTAASAPRPLPWRFCVRALMSFLMILTAVGGIVLDQSSRILEIRRRGYHRASIAMLLSSLAMVASGVIAWGISVTLLPLDLGFALHVGALFLTALALGLPGIVGVLMYSFHTSPGKALFLLTSFRFALTLGVLTLSVSAYLALSGWLARGLDTVADLIMRV
jgi:hypothetical protein